MRNVMSSGKLRQPEANPTKYPTHSHAELPLPGTFLDIFRGHEWNRVEVSDELLFVRSLNRIISVRELRAHHHHG